MHGKTNEMTCAQRRLRSAALLSHEESLGPLPLPFERTAKTDQILGPMGSVLKNDVH